MTAATVAVHEKAPPRRDRLRGVEFSLFFLLIFDGLGVPVLPVSVPLSELAAVALVAVGIFRSPARPLTRYGWYIPFWAILLAYCVIESWVNEVDWFRRTVRLVAMVVLSLQIATGRLDVWSGLRGLLAGLAVNVLLFYLRLAPDSYGGLLTGFLGDKNVAGLFYATVPLLALPCVSRARWRVALLVFAGVTVFLTGSRTSIAALAAGSLWVLVRRRLPLPFHLPMFAALYAGLQYLEANFAHAWIFSDRTGTDLLRSRIDEASWQKAEGAPPYGLGLGEATVYLDGRSWFFHNSFLGLYVEGGWVLLVAVTGVLIAVALPLLRATHMRPPIALEAAAIALLFCASRLGEVLLALPVFLLLGCVMAIGLQRGLAPPKCEKAAEAVKE
jgi:hypothetical protein